MTKIEIREKVREFLPSVLLKTFAAAVKDSTAFLTPLIEDKSIDGFDTSYEGSDNSFTLDVYYPDGLCDIFTVASYGISEVLS